MMTDSKIKPDQVALVNIARRAQKLAEPAWRMLLWNVGGVKSSKDLTQTSFEDVLATLESMGFWYRDHAPDHFRAIVLSRGSFASSRVIWKIQELAALQKYDLGGLCRRVSGGRVCRADRLSPQEGAGLLEMLKAIIARAATDGRAVKRAAEAAGGLAEPATGAGMPSEAMPETAGL